MKKSKIAGEFKTFITKGNVIDMAVGIIIGAAFQKIVTSFVNDLVMPFIGLMTGNVSFNERFLILKLPEGVAAETVTSLETAKELGVTTFNYGAFITAVIDFLIIALAVFFLIKAVNRLRTSLEKLKNDISKDEKPAAPVTKKCPFCCSDIPLAATRCPHCTSVLSEEISTK